MPIHSDTVRGESRSETPRIVTGSATQRTAQVVFVATVAALTLIVLYLIRDVAGAFVLGALLAFLINPIVDWGTDHRVPRVAGILICFAVLIAVVAGLSTMMAPLLTTEFRQLRQQAPHLAGVAQDRLSQLQGQPLEVFGFHIDLTKASASLSQHANDFLLGNFGNALGFGITAVTTLLQILLMLIVGFLLALDAHRISHFLRELVPTASRTDFDAVWADVQKMLRSYLRGQLVIASLIGIFSGAAIALLGLPFALALGLLAAITALVPYLGPVLGAIPAVLVGLGVSPQEAVIVAVVYLVISNVILNFVYPKVVGDAVQLPPLLVIVAFIAGFSLGGILGMFIAVPVAAVLRILYDYLHPRLYGAPA